MNLWSQILIVHIDIIQSLCSPDTTRKLLVHSFIIVAGGGTTIHQISCNNGGNDVTPIFTFTITSLQGGFFLRKREHPYPGTSLAAHRDKGERQTKILQRNAS